MAKHEKKYPPSPPATPPHAHTRSERSQIQSPSLHSRFKCCMNNNNDKNDNRKKKKKKEEEGEEEEEKYSGPSLSQTLRDQNLQFEITLV